MSCPDALKQAQPKAEMLFENLCFVARYSLLASLIEVYVCAWAPPAFAPTIAVAYAPGVWTLRAIATGTLSREVHAIVLFNAVIAVLMVYLPPHSSVDGPGSAVAEAYRSPPWRRVHRMRACGVLVPALLAITCNLGPQVDQCVSGLVAIGTALAHDFACFERGDWAMH